MQLDRRCERQQQIQSISPFQAENPTHPAQPLGVLARPLLSRRIVSAGTALVPPWPTAMEDSCAQQPGGGRTKSNSTDCKSESPPFAPPIRSTPRVAREECRKMPSYQVFPDATAPLPKGSVSARTDFWPIFTVIEIAAPYFVFVVLDPDTRSTVRPHYALRIGMEAARDERQRSGLHAPQRRQIIQLAS